MFTVANGYLTAEPREWSSIAHHLRIAAERYADNAIQMDAANQPRLANQFRDQAAQARKFSEEIENLAGV